MRVDLQIMSCFRAKKGFYAFAERIDPSQPAQSAPADLGRTFLLLVNFPQDI